jgi:hypothetical protein
MNYEASARSNYFRVKDEGAFRQWADRLGLSVAPTDLDDGRYFAIWPFDGGSWPSSWHNIDTDEEGQCDVVVELARHLYDGGVAVLMEVGHEGLRSVAGVALAVNAKGETRHVALEEIYDKARELGTRVIRAEY